MDRSAKRGVRDTAKLGLTQSAGAIHGARFELKAVDSVEGRETVENLPVKLSALASG